MRKGKIISMALFMYTCCEPVVTRLHDFVLNIFFSSFSRLDVLHFFFVLFSSMLSFPFLCKMSCTHCWQIEKYFERQKKKLAMPNGIWTIKPGFKKVRERKECSNIELYLHIFRFVFLFKFSGKTNYTLC